ncbi:unnamed protein product [Linum perenne]
MKMAARAFGFATVVLSMAVLLQLVIHAHGAVHKVGDSAGWTTIGSPDYKKWSATKSFQVGDIVRFRVQPSVPQRDESDTCHVQGMQCLFSIGNIHNRERFSRHNHPRPPLLHLRSQRPLPVRPEG